MGYDINEQLCAIERFLGWDSEIVSILDKAAGFAGLTHLEVASLLRMDDKHLPRLFQVARSIKGAIYGNCIVMFAPLYVSNF